MNLNQWNFWIVYDSARTAGAVCQETLKRHSGILVKNLAEVVWDDLSSYNKTFYCSKVRQLIWPIHFIVCTYFELMPECESTDALKYDNTEAVARRCSVKKVFLEISQNSQENTCVIVSFLIKLQAWACNFIKKETLALVFSCEF